MSTYIGTNIENDIAWPYQAAKCGSGVRLKPTQQVNRKINTLA